MTTFDFEFELLKPCEFEQRWEEKEPTFEVPAEHRRSFRQVKLLKEDSEEECEDEPYPKTGIRGSPQMFPRKLRKMLEEVAPHVMAWNTSGNGFHIFDIDVFTSEVLLKYFRHQNYTSFQRQLNLYKFKKICKGYGPDVGSYIHDSFQRDKPGLLPNVIRPKCSRTLAR